MESLYLRCGVLTAARPTKEGQTEVDENRKHVDISRKFFHVLEKNESFIEETGGKLEEEEAGCKAMRGRES